MTTFQDGDVTLASVHAQVQVEPEPIGAVHGDPASAKPYTTTQAMT